MIHTLEVTSLDSEILGDEVFTPGSVAHPIVPDLRLVRLSECKTQSIEDRELRKRLHHQRYLIFQSGSTIKEIAQVEGVDERQIYLSISKVESRLPRAEVVSDRNFRNTLIAQHKLAEKYIQTLSDLMDGKGGKNWYQRCRALQHFRRTVGLEGNAAVLVKTEVNMGSGTANNESYEQRLARIRAAQKARMESVALPVQAGRVLAMLSSGTQESD
jgi:hypothetical protein